MGAERGKKKEEVRGKTIILLRPVNISFPI
jgi:hypothetical protein